MVQVRHDGRFRNAGTTAGGYAREGAAGSGPEERTQEDRGLGAGPGGTPHPGQPLHRAQVELRFVKLPLSQIEL